MDIVKCEKCVKAGKKSKVFIGESTKNLNSEPGYYGEDGIWVEPPNSTLTQYDCSNGHKWIRTH